MLFNGGNLYFVEVSEAFSFYIFVECWRHIGALGRPQPEFIERQKTFLFIIGRVGQTNSQANIKNNTRNFKPYPDSFHDVSLIYQIWYIGLDLNRLCAPEHIIEMSNSSIC